MVEEAREQPPANDADRPDSASPSDVSTPTVTAIRPAPPVTPTSPEKGTSEIAGLGAAGLGGGTLVAIFASTLPEGVFKTILIWFTPCPRSYLARSGRG